MKKTALIAFAGAMLVSGAALAGADGVKEYYVSGAFDDADSDWRRITSNSTRECGAFGNKDVRRIDILIARYEALGEAIDAGDDAAISEAAQHFNQAVSLNERFEACWDKISRKNGISSSFKKEVAKA